MKKVDKLSIREAVNTSMFPGQPCKKPLNLARFQVFRMDKERGQ